jgi:hypothetical protein
LFDTFMGLPTHILVLHFTVVLVPLSAFATIAVFLRTEWRKKYAGWLAILNVAMLAVTFVTVRAGWDFQHRFRILGDTETPGDNHENLGKALLWIMVALAALAVIAWWICRMPNLAPVVGLGVGGLVASVAVASIVLTALAGHTGAKTTYADFIKSTDKKMAKMKNSPPPAAAPETPATTAPVATPTAATTTKASTKTTKAPAAKPKS